MSRLVTLFQRLQTLRQIRRINSDKDLGAKICKAYFSAFILRRIDVANKIVNLGAFKLSYLDYGLFDYLFREIFLGQEYRFISSNENPLIIDCGSNIGVSVFYFKLLYPNSRIICFEPDQDIFNCLKKNIEQNNFQSVEANMKAVSDREGKIEFFYDAKTPGALGGSTIRERSPKEKKEVNSVRLSTYVNQEVDFLKLDVEGAELGVIQELSKSAKLKYMKQIAIEYHHHIIRDQDVLSQILGTLENSGFGYQISGELRRPLERQKFQDILIYAYRKGAAA